MTVIVWGRPIGGGYDLTRLLVLQGKRWDFYVTLALTRPWVGYRHQTPRLRVVSLGWVYLTLWRKP